LEVARIGVWGIVTAGTGWLGITTGATRDELEERRLEEMIKGWEMVGDIGTAGTGLVGNHFWHYR